MQETVDETRLHELLVKLIGYMTGEADYAFILEFNLCAEVQRNIEHPLIAWCVWIRSQPELLQDAGAGSWRQRHRHVNRRETGPRDCGSSRLRQRPTARLRE
jgi:hypothetical protein